MSFPADSAKPLVADASVIINFNATLCAHRVITALSGAFVITENACMELNAGLRNGHEDAAKLDALIKRGVVRVVGLGAAGLPIYESLVEGAAEWTLDDGEAATIAYACESDGIAIVDERKARSLCADWFPLLGMASSAELLASDVIGRELGKQEQIAAIVGALKGGRMRVPPEHVGAIIGLIGETNAASCTSLPKAAKRNLIVQRR
jgi:predicted nucleic acid-binding protein